MQRYHPDFTPKQKMPHIFWVMGVLILALCVTVTVLAVKLLNRPVIFLSALPEKVEELNFILFRDEVLAVDKTVPLNLYDRASFSYSGERLQYDDGTQQAIFGIDVSTFQGEIDWEKVKADGVEFAMLRVGGRGYTEGAIYEDEGFREYIEGASAAGIHVGIYFFSQAVSAEEAVEEANYVLERLEGYNIAYPVVFDWEFISYDEARTDDMDKAMLTECALAFCGEIEKAGYIPMVYFNMTVGYHYYDLAALGQYELWLAELDEPPTFHYNFQMLQYSHTGTVDGVEKQPVDLNLSFVDYADR